MDIATCLKAAQVSPGPACAVLLLASMAVGASAHASELGALIEANRALLGPAANDPETHRVQVRYTRIERDADNTPTFHTETWGVTPETYFYPASVVKFPIAVAALEFLDDLEPSGVDRDTPMLSGAARPAQSTAEEDPTAPSGMPSVAHYVKKLFIVSDNDASNRLFELVGVDDLHHRLDRYGMGASRIVHRLALRLPIEENRHSNPVEFIAGGVLRHAEPAREGADRVAGVAPIPLGRGEIIDGALVAGPKNFARQNHLPLADVHGLLQAVIFPDSVAEARRPRLSPTDRALLLEAMSVQPAASGIEAYRDNDRYPDGFANYLIVGRDGDRLPSGVHIFNKVGRAYGFLTETAYVADLDQGAEFMVSATVYANANGVFNDDVYEYEEIGLPFLAALGEVLLEHERGRSRLHAPDFARMGAEWPFNR